MKPKEIRKEFLEYFNKNNHKIVHSGPLVPHNDPSLMFANSGMVQFKNIFTGKEKRDYNRAVTSQKCVRAGGKHNDLENVGYTNRHHTFFEMLGNFSFGDYFKDTAIELAWKLITREFKINKEKIIVTVYHEDEDAFNFWKKISGLHEKKIIKIASNDNFWSMGETGPCGPCSEIFYDYGDKFKGDIPGSENEEGDRFIEIWNLVFMQFEQINKLKRINLPKPCVDTGMGLERISALLSGTNDNYYTDLFKNIINATIKITGSNKYDQTFPSFRVIADHLRSASFLIADGVLPSNEGRGYVLRRIMRRGMRHAHSLGNKEPIFNKIFPILLEEMKDSFPELELAKDLISSTLLNEEKKFKKTIDNGLKILEEEIKNSSKIFSGDIAFKLYDTYGFPLDLTQDYLKSFNISVDIEQFEKNMKSQKETARKNWKGTGDVSDEKIWFDVTENLLPTDFIGYEKEKSECIINKIIANKINKDSININDEAHIILNQTPFYGESGGQIGDSGIIENENFTFQVFNTSKLFNEYYLHFGKVVKGSCKINDKVSAIINSKKRLLIRNNHSSTHLLHAALRKIIGKHVAQKGSLVSDKKLRFDFSHNEIIKSNNIEKIENLVNTIISQNFSVKIQILDQETAINEGATALFGEKYGDEVRVVTIGELENIYFSKELCGGTHVNKTSEIKKFKIINQSSISSGIRRIEAITNEEVDLYEKRITLENKKYNEKSKNEFNKYLNLINEIDNNIQYDFNKLNKIEDKIKEVKKIYLKLQQNIIINKFKKNIQKEKIGEINFIYLFAHDYPTNSFKSFIDNNKKGNNKTIVVLVSVNNERISIIIGVTNDLIETFDARLLTKISSLAVGGEGGGGRKDLAQAGGNLIENIPEIPNILKKEIFKLI